MSEKILEAEAATTPRRVIVVGGVAGGMSAAARLRRLEADADITVIERSGHVSYANCGLPYFVGGVIEEEEDLLVQTPGRLHDRFRLDVRVDCEVIAIDGGPPDRHDEVDDRRHRGAAGLRPARAQPRSDFLAASYSRLRPRAPATHGGGRCAACVRRRRASPCGRRDRCRLHRPRDRREPPHAGIAVTIVEAAPQVLTPLDPELAVLVADELRANGVTVEVGVAVTEIGESQVTLADGRLLGADLVVGALGVRPDVRLAEFAGLEPGRTAGSR